MYSLSETITATDPLSSARYSQSLNNAMTQGHPYDEAAQLATNSLYNMLQQQSLLLALKEILGYLLVISVVIAVISRFIPFHKTIRVTFKKTATRVAITTGDLPKMVVTQSGKEAKEAEACETPIPRAAARPTMEVLR